VPGGAQAQHHVLPPTAKARGVLRAVPQGTALRLSALRGGDRYRDTFLREFDSMTPENELNMQTVQPRRGKFDFGAADELVRFARANGKTVHGHTLVWGQSLPLWLIDHGVTDKLGLRLPPINLPPLPDPLGRLLGNPLTLLTGWRRDELLSIMQDHIRTVMRHFVGDIGEWDVVNEPLADDGTLAQTSGRGSSARTTSPRRCGPPTPPIRARSSSSTTSASSIREPSSTASSSS
jgi:endo-1,4-beta-xylanase